MRNNETGEFELVVGDRQLLSAFFIVVLLCAVAFAMGYVVGQNAPKSGKVVAETASPAQPVTAQDGRPQPLAPAPAPQTNPAAAAETAAAKGETPAAPQPTTQPAQGSEPPKPAEQPPAPQPAPAASSTGIVAADALPPGNFWQVMAVSESTADMMRTTLKDHGFNVLLTPGSKGLIRVLVGPYPDTAALGKAKTELETAGMHPVRYKQ